jgi:hypothetical protein
MVRIVAYWFILGLSMLFILVPFLQATVLEGEVYTILVYFSASILSFIHALVAVFSGWRGDRCQTNALDLPMKELEVKRSSAQPQNVLSPSTQHDPDLS